MRARSLWWAAILFAVACGDASGGPDDAAVDAPGMEAGFDAAPDATTDGASDAVADAPVDATSDTGGAGGGFGTIAGPCAMIHGELGTTTPSYFSNRLDFGADPFDDPEDLPLLTEGGREILADGTAGGSSGLSEAFAYEVLARCEGASLRETETEIVYDTMGDLTDMVVEIEGVRLGVSVTRAFVFPPSDPYTVAIATDLLNDKLMGVLESSANVSAEDAWAKQILVVVAYADMHAGSIMTAYEALDSGVKADTIVYVVVTDGMDEPLY